MKNLFKTILFLALVVIACNSTCRNTVINSIKTDFSYAIHQDYCESHYQGRISQCPYYSELRK